MECSLTVAPAALGTDENGDITRLACFEPCLERYAVHVEDDGALGSEGGIADIEHLDRREVSSAALLGRLSDDRMEPVEFFRRGEGRLAPIRPIKEELPTADLGTFLDEEFHLFGAIGDGVAEGETEGRVGGIISSLDEVTCDRTRVERHDRIDRVGTSIACEEYARLSHPHPQDADDLVDELGIGECDDLPELSTTIHESLHRGTSGRAGSLCRRRFSCSGGGPGRLPAIVRDMRCQGGLPCTGALRCGGGALRYRDREVRR